MAADPGPARSLPVGYSRGPDLCHRPRRSPRLTCPPPAAVAGKSGTARHPQRRRASQAPPATRNGGLRDRQRRPKRAVQRSNRRQRAVGWDNPPVPWREFERRLSWRGSSPGKRAGGPGRGGDTSQAGGGKVIRLRQATESADRPALPADGPAPLANEPAPQATAPWAELHCHSCYSFLDGASSPEELIAEAAERGLSALAITDHDGMYGVPQFAQAAARLWQRTGIQLGTVFGAELSLLTAGQALTAGRMAGQARAAERAGSPDPAGQHLLVLARDPEG